MHICRERERERERERDTHTHTHAWTFGQSIGSFSIAVGGSVMLGSVGKTMWDY